MEGVEARPEEIRDSIAVILQNIDNSLSGYNRKSLLSLFNAGERIVPDSIFEEIYRIGYDVYGETGGAVDVASGPLFDIWGFGFANSDLPSDDKVRQVMQSCGMSRLKNDMAQALSQDGSLRPEDLLIVPGESPKLNYNAIAQGYSCDLVARYLYSIGVKDMLV
ncbi:MAG: FAD:protein FMN transferase, partial [Bacteroidales bacterium]|nr:FAD:protein FMN transferase [Bacteroidales bacterium]